MGFSPLTVEQQKTTKYSALRWVLVSRDKTLKKGQYD